ncbi:hypothetical protein CR513_40567, partial [Mucuna pruriens]
DYKLIDVDFQSSSFTWQQGNLMDHLSRMLIYLRWHIRFQETHVYHLAQLKLDHTPLRPFKLLAAWMSVMHEDFPNMIFQSEVERETKEIWKEYEETLAQEELMSFQQIKSKWLTYKDMNTIDDGYWDNDPNELEQMTTNFYRSLFLKEFSIKPFCVRGAFLSLSPDKKEELSKRVRGEVRNAIFHIGVVGYSLGRLVKEIFENSRKVEGVNEILISLIPKVKKVQSLKNFRPISLYNEVFHSVRQGK